jgi:cobalt-zinc-cadmium efflux system outer membrane protein
MVYRAAVGALMSCLAMGVHAQARLLTFDEALRRAEDVAPPVSAAQAQLAAGEAELKEANALLWSNPVLSANLTHRRIPQVGLSDARASEWAFGIAQAFETGGQSAHRRAAASAVREALAYAVADAKRRLRAEVSQRFFRTLALQQRVQIEREAQRIAEEASSLVAKRVAAGEDSRLDGNLARIEAERARNQAAAAREAHMQARAELAAILQLPLDALPELAGELAPPAPAAREAALEGLSRRPDLLALERRVAAARERVQLERAARAPDLTLGVVGGREQPSQTFTTLAISVPLPIYKRNDAAISRAVAELTQAELELRAAQSGARAELAGLLDRYATLEERVRRLATEVLPAVEENLRLSRRAREAGEIAVPQLLLVMRQAVEARRELLEAQTEQRLVATAIEAVAARQHSSP